MAQIVVDFILFSGMLTASVFQGFSVVQDAYPSDIHNYYRTSLPVAGLLFAILICMT